MISELFFCFMGQIVEVNFERNPLTQTLTHTPLADDGQGGTKEYLLAPNTEKIVKLLIISM